MAKFPSSPRFPTPDSWARPTVPPATFVPVHYEPHYAYPLLVLFHGRGGDEQQLLPIIPRLSQRNYVAIGLRGLQRTRPRRDGSMGYGWAQAARGLSSGEGAATLGRPRWPALSEASCDLLADHVSPAVTAVKQRLNIHTGKIFLVGYGEGAAAAYRLGLGMPGQFAGIIAVNGWLPRSNGPLLWLPEARHLRVLIVHGHGNRLVPVSAGERAYRLLRNAGINTSLHLLESGHRIPAQLLRLIDHWLMDFCALHTQPSPVL